MNCFKFVSFALSTAFISTSAFAAQGVYGTWKLPVFDQAGLTIVSTTTISQGLISSNATCTIGGQSANVSVSAPATISASQIIVTDQASKSVSVGGTTCDAGISPMTVDYTVSADDSTLTMSQGGQSFSLPRQ